MIDARFDLKVDHGSPLSLKPTNSRSSLHPIPDMSVSSADLPDECWELIFNRSDHHSRLEAPSLTCKQFLCIINDLRTHLRVLNPTILIPGNLSKLLRRFPRLKSIDLSELVASHANSAIQEISQSGLIIESLNISKNPLVVFNNLMLCGEKMKGLRVLNCADMSLFCDFDCRAIAKTMPFLEELDISSGCDAGDVSDCGIEALSLALKGLRKINFSGNLLVTDKSLVALSSNCGMLKEIILLRCSLVTANGIRFVMQNSPKLSSLLVEGVKMLTNYANSLPISDSRFLSTLEIYDSVVSYEFMCALAVSGIPLKRVSLAFCTHFTYSGLVSLLRSYDTLEYLDLTKIVFLNDGFMLLLVRYIQNLVTLKLRSCPLLTASTFFMLVKKCPLLEVLDMGATNIGGGNCIADVVKSSRIKILNLGGNKCLTDECLTKLASACPSLEQLDVSSCPGITEEGVAAVLESNSKIRHLQISECWGVKSIGPGHPLPNLEILCAARSGINDQGLAMISYRCCGLLKLDLEGCSRATSEGIGEVLKNCKRLKEMNLKSFDPSNLGTLDRMVFARPSLRKLTVPSSCLPSESQRNLYMRHGCVVCEG